ncbi:MAG: 4Fe-4S ferredoxin [Desulfobacteraceae bacterium]|nr:4Fe-4S ferredoxin [Desulfobacteraceae bacterium]
MKVMRKIIEIDEELCNGCGNCVIACAEGAIQIIDGKAKVIADKYCDGLGACIGDCPEDALKIIEREADDFDEEAVEALLEKQKAEKKPAEPVACGCPSSAMKTFPVAGAAEPCGCSNHASVQTSGGRSSLGHWPVQIKLVPAGAPFLKDADLVIAADCVPVAYPTFHADFLKGKAVMIGCPKFDDADEYVEKLSQVFKVSGIKTITAAVMEVPCCSAMPIIVKKALAKAGVEIPFEEVVVSARGEILS